mgnify:CR=1 FL=1
MDKQFKDIIVRDSRSENMLRRLLDISDQDRSRRQRWMLLANGGLLRSLKLSGESELVDRRNWIRELQFCIGFRT